MTENDKLPSIEDLAVQVQNLRDEQAVLQTLYRYGHTIDYGLDDEWVDCFTENGIFDVRRRLGPADTIHQGKEALTKLMNGRARAPEVFVKHMLCESRINIDGDKARVESYWQRLEEIDGEPIVRAFGRYRDRMIKCTDSVWRFVERIVEIEAMSSKT